ncbi:MAG: hypothetical protein ACK4S4_06845 [Pyrinomonadaceae bacterium]
MEQRQCAQCGGSVDAAKAFCPECGAAMIAEESRQDASDYDASPRTVQFGQTMFNQVLSDMGLTDAGARTDDKTPTTGQAPPRPSSVTTLKPVASSSADEAPPRPPSAAPSAERGPGKPGLSTKWIVVLVASAVALLLAVAALAAAAVILYLLSRG